VQKQFGSEVNIIGVGGRGNVEDMKSFVDEYGVFGFEHIADEDTQIWFEFGVTSQPAFVFINDDGTSETLISSLGQEGLTERIEALIAS
jgi:hypothetical protein